MKIRMKLLLGAALLACIGAASLQGVVTSAHAENAKCNAWFGSQGLTVTDDGTYYQFAWWFNCPGTVDQVEVNSTNCGSVTTGFQGTYVFDPAFWGHVYCNVAGNHSGTHISDNNVNEGLCFDNFSPPPTTQTIHPNQVNGREHWTTDGLWHAFGYTVKKADGTTPPNITEDCFFA